jgi:L-iditol 2-dehydrogenase
MRAAVFYGPEDIRVENVAEPELPVGGLVIQTAATGICGSDLRTYRFGHPKILGKQILGHELAGVVVQSDCVDYSVGTAVAVAPGTPCLECEYCRRGKQNMCRFRTLLGRERPGGLAEQFAVSGLAVRAGVVVKVPDTLPLRYAPVAEPLNAVLNGQDRAQIGPYQRVLVLGLGPIGVLHVATARNRGAEMVIGADPLEGRVASAADMLGEKNLIQIAGDWELDVLRRTGGDGFDVVVIANTAPQAFDTAMRLIAPQGRIVVFAGLSKDAPAVAVNLNDVHYREIQVVGAFGATPRHFRAAVQWLGEGHLDLDRFVTVQIPIDDVVKGLEAVGRGEGVKTMVVF